MGSPSHQWPCSKLQLIHCLDDESLVLANDFSFEASWLDFQSYILNKTKSQEEVKHHLRCGGSLNSLWVWMRFQCAFFLLSLLINTVLWLLIFGAVGRGDHEFFFNGFYNWFCCFVFRYVPNFIASESLVFNSALSQWERVKLTPEVVLVVR